ncbi:hypothetical protein [Magnetospirillum fulvum]|uniref:Uncharacterized protein n=1 Tax=Magnetospirillum fulvum TaxID=1082 RepID=A0A1H6H4G7_MAGFU|nr:hypothetical protein [Magnetospirillum fulvum]SEH28893.1 hypothetical protein SAMN04244559_00774 [Magnetospirillum fulvum]
MSLDFDGIAFWGRHPRAWTRGSGWTEKSLETLYWTAPWGWPGREFSLNPDKLPVFGDHRHKALLVNFRRDTMLHFFEQADPATVGMEACPGSQWLTRYTKRQ